MYQFSSVQSLSRVRHFATPWSAEPQGSLSITLLEFTQTHVHWVSDAIQPSHPLLSPSPPAPNPSQHQSLFPWVNSSHEVAKVLCKVKEVRLKRLHTVQFHLYEILDKAKPQGQKKNQWLLGRRVRGKENKMELFFFSPHYAAYRILVPKPGIKPVPLVLRACSLTTGPPGNPQERIF